MRNNKGTVAKHIKNGNLLPHLTLEPEGASTKYTRSRSSYPLKWLMTVAINQTRRKKSDTKVNTFLGGSYHPER